MHKLTFFPVGTGDTIRIDLENNRKMLIDFADMRDPTDKLDKRIPLSDELRADLKSAKRDYYDVVAFTHLDNDHIAKAPEFFFLETQRSIRRRGGSLSKSFGFLLLQSSRKGAKMTRRYCGQKRATVLRRAQGSESSLAPLT